MRNTEQTELPLNPSTLTLHLYLYACLWAFCIVACVFGFAPVRSLSADLLVHLQAYALLQPAALSAQTAHR